MVADIRGVPNRYVLKLGGVDMSSDTTSASLGKSTSAPQTFSEFRTGGPFALKLTALQNYVTGSIWDLAVNQPGSAVTGQFYPRGTTTGSPVFTITATTSAPTSDASVGGAGGAVDAEAPTFDTEWLLSTIWAQSTA